MPFEKGNKLAVGIKSGGRKGYEYEQKELKRMRKLLNGLFALGEKIQGGKATAKQVERFNTMLKLNLKIMDKLHANKQSHEITGEGGQPLIIKLIKFKDKDGDNNST